MTGLRFIQFVFSLLCTWGKHLRAVPVCLEDHVHFKKLYTTMWTWTPSNTHWMIWVAKCVHILLAAGLRVPGWSTPSRGTLCQQPIIRRRETQSLFLPTARTHNNHNNPKDNQTEQISGLRDTCGDTWGLLAAARALVTSASPSPTAAAHQEVTHTPETSITTQRARGMKSFPNLQDCFSNVRGKNLKTRKEGTKKKQQRSREELFQTHRGYEKDAEVLRYEAMTSHQQTFRIYPHFCLFSCTGRWLLLCCHGSTAGGRP